MNVKSVHKTVIEVTKQEIVDELINNFIEIIFPKNNKVENVLKESEYLYQSLKYIDESKYEELFTGGNALRCLPDNVFDEVEEYFYGGEDDDGDEEISDSVISFKKASKEIKETELEISIKDGSVIVARIPESQIQH